MRAEERWRNCDHPIISNFNLNAFRASNNNNNNNKFPPNKRYLVWEWYFQWAIPIRIRHQLRKHSERGQKQHRSTSIQWIVWKSNFHKVNLWTLCLLPSNTLFSAWGNFSVEFIHSQFGCGLGRTWVCERVYVGEMWVAIEMRIFLCFSSINKTAAINLNIGRRFHAKLCLVLASLQPLCVHEMCTRSRSAADEVKFEIWIYWTQVKQ